MNHRPRCAIFHGLPAARNSCLTRQRFLSQLHPVLRAVAGNRQGSPSSSEHGCDRGQSAKTPSPVRIVARERQCRTQDRTCVVGACILSHRFRLEKGGRKQQLRRLQHELWHRRIRPFDIPTGVAPPPAQVSGPPGTRPDQGKVPVRWEGVRRFNVLHCPKTQGSAE